MEKLNINKKKFFGLDILETQNFFYFLKNKEDLKNIKIPEEIYEDQKVQWRI